KVIVDLRARSAFGRELGIVTGRVGEPCLQDAVMEVLRSLHGGPPSSERIKRLALILEQCDDLDAACELDATVSGEQDLNGLDGIVSEVGRYFGAISDSDFETATSRMP